MKEPNLVNYSIYGVTVTEVEVDMLTGQYQVIIISFIKIINYVIDSNQNKNIEYNIVIRSKSVKFPAVYKDGVVISELPSRVS